MFFYPFYGVSLLVIAVQVFFAVHCIRRGNPGWLIIIIFFPFVGSLVYLFVEYLPEMRARNTIGTTARRVKERLNPAAEIQRLEDQVAVSNSHNNRMELARGYLRAGRADDAIALYRQSLVGMYEDDVPLLFELAAAYHAVGRLDEARATFEQLRANASMLSNDHLLLSARIYDDAGDLDGAAREYRALLARPVIGEEARCRYALVLKQLGRTAEAHALFDEIVRHARLSPGHYRKAQKPWIDIAKKELAGQAAAG
ncbi:tetratricopeptide repeat protein [Longimicrobium sp.]|uniref:tetratricopeptide repeat protein n=1 Tax=Longimicrobium sp. TaxID=2029185 RepID=UPI002B63B8FB|nr:tetratricopeptide repeat protein [Longimicrobium sp.]HSU13948.1 tetratricopeptide repeat protein [Longimicrobium sp.]